MFIGSRKIEMKISYSMILVSLMIKSEDCKELVPILARS